jgi:hypothetical protein
MMTDRMLHRQLGLSAHPQKAGSVRVFFNLHHQLPRIAVVGLASPLAESPWASIRDAVRARGVGARGPERDPSAQAAVGTRALLEHGADVVLLDKMGNWQRAPP